MSPNLTTPFAYVVHAEQTCPTCGALPGQNCRSLRSNYVYARQEVHPKRLNAYNLRVKGRRLT